MSFNIACREIVSTCLLLADKGYLAGTGGNVACRVDEEHFAITPSATDYYAMSADDVCVLRLGDLKQVAGDLPPSVEARLHANILRARRDCNASIHTHQPIASAYTLLGRALEIADAGYQALLGPRVPAVGYAPSGTKWLAGKVGRAIQPGINAYLMRNHGVVCCGPSLQDTVAKVEALEAACTAFFRDAIERRVRQGEEPHMQEILELLGNPAGAELAV